MHITWGYRATLDLNNGQITTYKQYVGTARYKQLVVKAKEMYMGIFPPRRETVFGVPLSSLEVGQRTEAFIVHRLMECGYTVLTPLGVQRYDLVIEDADGKFWRIQCKTGRPRNGTIEFNTRNSSIPGAKKIQRNYRGDTDYFAVYSKETGKVYLVPVGAVGTSLGYLRVEPVKNHLQKGVRWAKDYEL